jgi:hypothetical protein
MRGVVALTGRGLPRGDLVRHSREDSLERREVAAEQSRGGRLREVRAFA